MKKYQHWSLEALKSKRQSLFEDIEEWNSILARTKSALIQLSLTHYIKRAKEEIRAIDAELCYREHENMTV